MSDNLAFRVYKKDGTTLVASNKFKSYQHIMTLYAGAGVDLIESLEDFTDDYSEFKIMISIYNNTPQGKSEYTTTEYKVWTMKDDTVLTGPDTKTTNREFDIHTIVGPTHTVTISDYGHFFSRTGMDPAMAQQQGIPPTITYTANVDESVLVDGSGDVGTYRSELDHETGITTITEITEITTITLDNKY